MTAGYREQALALGSRGALVGVLTQPDGPVDLSRPVVITVNAGLVHRVGPQRMHVTLLRRLAQCGFTGMRFDFSGIGDSPTRTDQLPYIRSTLEELREVMDDVTTRTGHTRFCVIGLSSGALVAMAGAGADPRVAGVGMLNPHGFGASSVWGEHVESVYLGKVYAGNVFSLHSWRKLLTGRTDYRRMWHALRYRLGGGRPAQGERSAELEATVQGARPELMAFLARALPTLMVFSQRDRSLHNLEQILGQSWRQRLGRNVKVVEIADANHTFASPVHLQQALQVIETWLVDCWPGAALAEPGPPPRRSAEAAAATPGDSDGF